MAKNRGWELLGHLVDILIFSQIKFSFQKFGLKLGGKLWNTGIHFSACFVGLVATDWQISGLNLKIAPKSEFVAPLAFPRKEVPTFVIIMAKVRSSQTFFM